MRIVAVCESPPTLDPRFGDGSTLISAHLLRRLPNDVELDLVYFADRPARPPDALLDRCSSVTSLSLAPALLGWTSHLPRAARLRATREAQNIVAALARRADVTYLHGLEVFPLALVVRGPLVVHEVDPWSLYWRERSAHAHGLRRVYDRTQARRAFTLEQAIAAQASRYLLVSAEDADVLGRLVGRPIDVLSNGIDRGPLQPRAEGDHDGEPFTIGFVGTLDYAPNVEAVKTLANEILPAVRRYVPSARLFVAGRRPTAEITALAGKRVQVVGDVADIGAAFRRPSVLVYPGSFGRGKKNTVLEALVAGRPVVASRSAARGVTPGPHIVLADDVDTTVSALVHLLTDADARGALRHAATDFADALPGWTEVAGRFDEILRAACVHHVSDQFPKTG